jgi:kynureninase
MVLIRRSRFWKCILALVLFGGINYYTGQLLDIGAITAAARKAGAVAGFDLAHAIGNVPLSLHDWDVDFAVWCSYKYLNAGPGAVGGAFIHQRHASNKHIPRMAGWWGNDEKTRFRMEKGFIPKPDASGWNISTAQVLNMVGLKASLELFEKTDIRQLRAKSMELTAWLEFLLGKSSHLRFEIITPGEPEKRGAQLSLFFLEKGKEIHQKMNEAGIVVDYREPGVIRVAPAPLYNSFEDVYRFYEILKTI